MIKNIYRFIDKDFLESYKDECDLTDEEFQIILMRRKKFFIYQIAQEINLSEGTVKNRLKEINQKLQDRLERKVYDLKSQGFGNFEIGQRIGITATTVSKLIQEIIKK